MALGLSDAMKLAPCTDAERAKGDRHRHFHVEAIKLGGDAHIKVEETEDYWIIPDTGLTTEGVMNGGFKPKEELARTWMLANGIPFSHDHPRDEDEMGVIVDLRRVGGFVDNVRFTDESGDVVGDVYLARKAQAGLAVTEENLRRNQFLIDAINAGEEAEVSIGFWSTDIWSPGRVNDVDYEWIQTEIAYDHLANVPLGACSWEMGCGLGRHQNAESNRLRTRGSVGGVRGRMSQEEAEQAARDAEAGQQQEARPAGDCAEGADGKPAGQPAGKPAGGADGQPARVKDAAMEAMKKRLDALESERKAERDAVLKERRTRLASLLNEKEEDLPELTVKGLDAWILREEQLQGKADPPLVGGDGKGAASAKWNVGEEVDGVTMTDRGLTVTDWEKAEAHARSGAATGGWKPTGALAPLRRGA